MSWGVRWSMTQETNKWLSGNVIIWTIIFKYKLYIENINLSLKIQRSYNCYAM